MTETTLPELIQFDAERVIEMISAIKGADNTQLLSALADDLNTHYRAMYTLGGKHTFNADTVSSLLDRWSLTMGLAAPTPAAKERSRNMLEKLASEADDRRPSAKLFGKE